MPMNHTYIDKSLPLRPKKTTKRLNRRRVATRCHQTRVIAVPCLLETPIGAANVHVLGTGTRLGGVWVVHRAREPADGVGARLARSVVLQVGLRNITGVRLDLNAGDLVLPVEVGLVHVGEDDSRGKVVGDGGHGGDLHL